MNQIAVMRLFIGDPGRESSERTKVHANADLLHAETSPRLPKSPRRGKEKTALSIVPVSVYLLTNPIRRRRINSTRGSQMGLDPEYLRSPGNVPDTRTGCPAPPILWAYSGRSNRRIGPSGHARLLSTYMSSRHRPTDESPPHTNSGPGGLEIPPSTQS